jgi:hypothetical protein
LRQCWRQWLEVVEVYARGERVQVDAEGYRVVRALLLEHCRAATGGTRPAVLQRLESVVEPWLTPQTLAATDRQTLASLLQHCARLNRELLGPQSRSLWRRALLPGAVAAVAVASWYVGEAFGLTANVLTALSPLWTFLRARPLLSLGVAAPVVLLAGTWLLSRLLRS